MLILVRILIIYFLSIIVEIKNVKVFPQQFSICHCETVLSRRSNLVLQGDCFVPRSDITHNENCWFFLLELTHVLIRHTMLSNGERDGLKASSSVLH